MKKTKTARRLGIMFIIIGIIIIGVTVFLRAKGEMKEKNLMQQFNQELQEVSNDKDNKSNSNDQSKTKNSGANLEKVMGVLTIPKIGCEVPICEGVDKEVIKYSVGHFKGTALPGKKGNCAIAGHRSYTYNEFFNRLDELEKGDDIYIQDKNKKYKYTIYEKKVVQPTEVSVLNNTKESEITLVTCTPMRSASHRLIIKGKLVNN